MVTGRNMKHRFSPNFPVGAGFIHRNTRVLPRARLMGRPVYADSHADAVAALERAGRRDEGSSGRGRPLAADP